MLQTPWVSIIIPCKDVDILTMECIEQCKRLDYPNFEMILLPDSSTQPLDGVQVIATGPVAPGTKRNIGVKNSKGDICAFIDNDAFPRRDWLSSAVKQLEDFQIQGVGGPGLTPEEDDFMQKAGGYVLSSFMVGTLSSRYKRQKRFESNDIHSCNFVARKSTLEAVGGWNEKYWPGEDTLMCLAIRKNGGKLIESSDVVVYHHRRSLFKPHLKQVSRFGEHRGFFSKKFPENSRKVTYFFPSLLLFFLLFGILISVIFPFFTYVLLLALGGYLVSSLAAAALQVKKAKMLVSVWLGIIATHLVYGVFFIFGLAKRDLTR